MGWCTGRSGPDRRLLLGRAARLASPLAALALLVAACSPTIEAWRSVNGVAKNDPDPETAPFTGNLAQAYEQPYPNLASVPPPPTEETSAAERERLTRALIADRTATASRGTPPPAAPASVAANASVASAAAGGPPGGGSSAPVRSAGAPRQSQALDASLQMPSIPTPLLPQPEAPGPAPPTPVLAAVPPTPAPATAIAPSPAAAVAGAMPQAPPSLPVLAPIASPPAAAKPPPPRPPAVAAATVAMLDVAAASAAPAVADRAQIARVASLYKEKPGTVRVIAFAAAPAPGADPLAAYHTALDRAQQVAKALAAAGVPAGKIETAANPASAGPQIGRIEIQLTP